MGSDRNIVLTGFMGTGKTTSGRLLASMLGLDFVDTDKIIENRHGPIADIFTNRGEEAFRQMEAQVAIDLSATSGHVISTGGAMLLDPANRAALAEGGDIICLVASAETLVERLRLDEHQVNRPLLSAENPQQRIVEILADRETGYSQYLQVRTDGLSPAEVAAAIAVIVRGEVSGADGSQVGR